MKSLRLFAIFCVALPLGCAAQSAPVSRIDLSRMDLKTGWSLQSGCKIKDTGERISTPSYQPHGWIATSVPTTVLGAQVAAGQLPDPYESDNLRKIPGTDYPVGKIFSRLPMSKYSPYTCSWWYRTAFPLPESLQGRTLSLHFEGINYRANLWINGTRVADNSQIAGAYRRYEFDVTSALRSGKQNAIALEVSAPLESDLAINWVDWNPAPPDKNMGLWRGVYLTTSGPMTLRYPTVTTHFTDNTLATAELSVIAEVTNTLDRAITANVEGKIESIHFAQPVELKPHESRTVRFTSQDFPQLRINQPRIWWPLRMGNPELYQLTMQAVIDGTVSERQQMHFGVREITSELTEHGYRLFRVNGKPILVRGGGWAPDMLLRESHQRLVDEFRYVREMGLNTIRLEGKIENDDFFNLADEQGILIMAGWCCCDHWEQWKKWGQNNELAIGTESVRSQALRLRSHPSVLVWLNGSDGPPPADVETAYLKALEDSSWPDPILSSAAATPTSITGRSGVKMTGPYDYVPPSYWLADKSNLGGAFGFNTETSPGPAIPPAACMRRMVGAKHLWPMDTLWNFHAGSGKFDNTHFFDSAMNATYGTPSGLADYERKAQAMAYDGERAMFEAYSRNKYESTGVIQWMLNNAWPSTIWHLYDFYLQPAGGYFGTRKANEPLHIQYSYDDQSIYVVNNAYDAATALKATATVYSFDLQTLFTHDETLDLPADGVKKIMDLPSTVTTQESPVLFIRLELHDQAGALVSSNFYWIPQHPSELDWNASDYRTTPIRTYEDLTALNHLPQAHLRTEAAIVRGSNSEAVRVTLTNTSKALAFQIRLGITRPGSEEEIVPVLWDDNYFELMPGESRTVYASFPDHKISSAVLRVSGWNIAESTIEFTPHVSQPVKVAEADTKK